MDKEEFLNRLRKLVRGIQETGEVNEWEKAGILQTATAPNKEEIMEEMIKKIKKEKIFLSLRFYYKKLIEET